MTALSRLGPFPSPRAIFLSVVLGLAGCAPPQPEAPLRVGLVVFPAYEAAFVARDMGLFTDDQIRLIDVGSPADALRAFRNGSVEAVAFTLDFALEALTTHPSTRIIFTPDVTVGADALVATSDIRTLQELEGKRVGLEASSLGVYMLSRALDSAGLEWDDVVKVPIDIPDQVDAFQAGTVDAVVTYDPSRTQLLNMGQHSLFSSADIDGEIVDVLITRAETIETRGDRLQLLVDSWIAGAEKLRTHPQESAEIVAQRQHLTPEDFLSSLEGLRLHEREENARMLGGSPAPVHGALDQVMTVMIEQGILDGVVDLSHLVDPRFVLTR